MKLGRIVAYVWVLILPSVPAFAQSKNLQLRFDHITVNDGLSHSDAMAVVQDQPGFIWIGTNKGVDRYDGRELKNYSFHVDQPFSLSDNRVRSLYVSPAGELWVGTENGGLNYYDRVKDRFIRINETQVPEADRPTMRRLSTASISSIVADKLGQLWVATYYQGVFILQRDGKGQITSVKTARLPEQNRTQFGVNDMLVDQQGMIWVGTIGYGLYAIDPRSSLNALLKKVAFGPQTIQALHLDRQANVWVGADDRIYRIPPTNTLEKIPPIQAIQPAAAFPGLESLHLDSFGRLWTGTAYGLYILQPGWNPGWNSGWMPGQSEKDATGAGKGRADWGNCSVERMLPEDGEPASLSSSRVHQIIEDKFQIMWIATSAGGINKANLLAMQFGHLQRQFHNRTSLPSNYINAIYKEEDKNLLWMATRNGFSKYEPNQKTYQNYLSQPLSGNATGIDVATIFQDSQRTLWFGTWSDGFTCLRREGNRERLTKYTRQPNGVGLSSNSVVAFAEDRLGTIWVATFDAGLNQFTKAGKPLKSYRQRNSALPTDNFTYLYYDKALDVLWASTQNAGLLKLRPTRDSLVVLKQFKQDPNDSLSLSVNFTWPLLKDHRGNLWIGTIGGGLHRLSTDRNGRETLVRYSNWLPESDVESILEDEQGNIWIGGAGLFRFNPSTRQYLKFDVADGLQSNSFKVGSACRARDGTLYFGGINGLSFFLPKAVQPNPYPPEVVITELRIFNKPVQIDEEINGRVLLTKSLTNSGEITIRAMENDFSLGFVALHYANPGKHRYAYKLEGYHTAWVYPPGDQRTASFANLASGTYTFLVKASNGDGKWTVRPATLHIRILPPWWKTWWAYTLYGCGILTILIVSRRIAVEQQELKNTLALEKLQHEKNKELTDLKLRFFTNVSHELRTPLTLILGPMEELIALSGKLPGMRDKVFIMHRQARKLLDLVNQLMDFRKAESEQLPLRVSEGDIVDFVHEIFLIFQPKASEKKMDYAFSSDLASLNLYFDRNKLEIVMTNLLSNAFKYTKEEGKIQVALSVVGDPTESATYRNGVLQQHYLRICVRDWGVGMHPAELDKIFDIYYQATHTETLRVMGTGIGLSLVKQVVERHAGEIAVESQPGEGTRFIIQLPLGRKHLSPADIQSARPEEEIMHLPVEEEVGADVFGEAASEEAEVNSLSDFTLLIVEDNEDVLSYLRTMFAPILHVQVARNGLEGWTKTLEVLPDLVLSDSMMPLSSGLELCKKIKQHPKTLHIPVLLLTARAAAVHELEGLEMGADDYLVKPFHPKLLKAKVLTVLHNRQKMQEYYHRQVLLQPTEISIPDADRLLLEAAMKIVEDHLEDANFNVQELVREMGMSQSVFYRRIKSITGQTAIDFIRDIRMKRAAQLLMDSSLRVSDIAFKVGMEDIKRFRKAFQKLYNMAPTEYAKKYRGVETDG